MFRHFLFFISALSFIFSIGIEHSYNSTVTSFTKTADPGRMNIAVTNNNAEYKDVYVDDTNYPFTTLTEISEINYKGYDIANILQESGLDIDDFHFTSNTFGFNTSYHGYNGMGYYASYKMEQITFPHSVSLQKSWEPSTTSITVGVYALWNEIYSMSAPAMVDGSQYTFPTTRILTGLYVNRYRGLFDEYSDILYLRLAMDFIVSQKLNLSNKLDYELSDDNDVFMSIFTTKFIYDLNDNVSVAGSLLFKQDNQGDYLLNFLLEGGYQFNNMAYGYTQSNLKLVPYFKMNIGGKNNIYSSEEFGFKIKLFFN